MPSYIEQELTPLDRGRLEAHVDSCAACQGELTGLKKTVNRERILKPGPFRLPAGVLAAAVLALLVVQVSRTTLPQLQRKQMAPSEQSLMVGWAPELAEREEKMQGTSVISQAADGLSEKSVFSRIYTAPLYYIRWQVANLKSASTEVNRFIRDISIRQVKHPQPARYYLVMSLEKLESFMDQLHSIGEPALIKPLAEFPSDFPPELPEEDQSASSVRWVVLELTL